jgi:hypothetical protein
MAITIKQVEAIPEIYPDAPLGMNAAATALDPALIWQRIEGYTAWRWSQRAVEWIVEGGGQWEPPLSPATITKAEIWRGGAWEELTLPAAPLGGFLLTGHGPYRFTGTVGEDDAEVPVSVKEAYRRLAEYSSQSKGKVGARVERIGAGSISLSHHRHEAWMARAMENSGAGDLLRKWRRAR